MFNPITIIFAFLFLCAFLFVLYAIHQWLAGSAEVGRKYLARERVITAERDIFWAMQRGDVKGVELAQGEYNSAVANAHELEALE